MGVVSYSISSIALILQYLFFCEITPSLVVRLFKQTSPIKKLTIRSTLESLITVTFIIYLTLAYKIHFLQFNYPAIINMGLIILMSVLLFVLTLYVVDPLLNKIFLKSAANYKRNVQILLAQGNRGLIKVCILAPLMEEIIVRGLIQGQILANVSIIISILVASTLFSALHFNWLQSLSALLPSLLLGIIYSLTGSLIVCIFIHVGYNFLSYWHFSYHFKGLK